MRRRLLAFMSALTVATAVPATAQTRIDLSSPDSVMASLQDLAGRWTHPQFIELLRAAILVQLPDYLDDPASFQRGLNRWTLQAEGVLLSMDVLIQAPLVLEGEPFLRHAEAELVKPWLHAFLSEALEGRTIEALVELGRARERGILVRWHEQLEDRLGGLEQQIEDARAVLSQPDASAQDAHALERLERQHREVAQAMDRFNRRLHALEEAEPFTPGAVECSLEEGIDLSTEQAMVADLERLADTCPQRSLITFLRAAALVSEVPVRLADPGARMHAATIREVEENLVSAADAIARLPALLQEDPFERSDDVPQRLAGILGNALAGRTMSEVMREGAAAERAFLLELRADLLQRLRAEMRGSEQTADASEPPNPRISRLRADIERIDERLALLRALPPAGEWPLAPN
jgi:hypothetical protein